MEYSVKELNLLWLDCFDFLTFAKRLVLSKIYNFESDIRTQLDEYINELRPIMDNADFNKMKFAAQPSFLEGVIKEYDKSKIIPITVYSPNYPALLRETNNPPFVLYCKGNIDLLNTRCLAVVGTRRPTDYGKIVTRQFVRELAKAGITIVSGLAHGVDTIAHETALSEGGNTIAVLAGGLHNIYPASNYNLSNRIIENNLLVSENRPDIMSQAYMFPIRNRVLAGLSEGVLITEAMENSGSLHTKMYAVDYNRELYVVPGRIDSIESRGCNKILKEMQGAITLSPQEILIAMRVEKAQPRAEIQLDIDESNILRYITGQKHSYQEILDYTALSPKQMNAILLSMQVRELVMKLAGNYYIAE